MKLREIWGNESMPFGPVSRRITFDLFHPPYRCFFHTFFNSILTSPPSRQIKERSRLHQRNIISSVNVATALSLSFSHHFTHKCFPPFSLSPRRETKGRTPNRKASGRKSWDTSFSTQRPFHWYFAVSSSRPWLPDLTASLPCVILSSAPLPLFYFHLNLVSLEKQEL